MTKQYKLQFLIICITDKKVFWLISFKKCSKKNTANLFKTMAKIRTEILIETSEIYIVRKKQFFVRHWCQNCNREVNMLSPSDAAFLTCQDTNTIYSLIDKKEIHYFYQNTESILICLRSLCLM